MVVQLMVADVVVVFATATDVIERGGVPVGVGVPVTAAEMTKLSRLVFQPLDEETVIVAHPVVQFVAMVRKEFTATTVETLGWPAHASVNVEATVPPL